MTYDTPSALRRAIEDRLANATHQRGLPVQRLRRTLVFERLVVRLDRGEPGVWVVKGGMALEWKLAGAARATKDLDLALREVEMTGPATRDRLSESLATDPDGDAFRFAVGSPEPLQPDNAGRAGFGFPARAELAGRLFEAVRLDIVPRSDELYETERLGLSRFLEFADIPTRDVEAAAPRQQFAEKLHAFTRDYGDRENSRVRDLADIVLLIEKSLVSPAGVVAVAGKLFDSRNTHRLPDALPDPPVTWGSSYSSIATEIGLDARTIEQAMARLRSFWDEAKDL